MKKVVTVITTIYISIKFTFSPQTSDAFLDRPSKEKKNTVIGCICYCDCQYCDILICRYIAEALLAVCHTKKHHMLLRRNGMHAQEYLRDTG